MNKPWLHSGPKGQAKMWQLLVVLCAVTFKAAPAQTWTACRPLLTTRETRGDRTTRSLSDSVYQVLNGLDHATWEWFSRWMQAHEGQTLGIPQRGQVGLAEEFHTRIKGDPNQQRIAALALAEMMRGEYAGLKSEQDVLAAVLYRDWDLPPGPAESLLADPQTSFRARRLAVAALEQHWGEQGFYEAAMGALCILAAEVDGIARLTDSTNVSTITDEAQIEFLLSVASALVAGYDNSPAGAPRVDRILPLGNPITDYVQRRLCRAFGCQEPK
jgi:hypothetical protein